MMCHSLNKFYYNSKYPIFTLNNLNFVEDDLNNYCVVEETQNIFQ